MDNNDANKWIRKDKNILIKCAQLKGSDIYQIRYSKSTVFQFRHIFIVIKALTTSKHIMNCVMCLVEDIGCLIFYQDTDSMYIHLSDVNIIGEEFKKKYGYQLIREELCQFHNDFDKFKDRNSCSDRLIISGKKHYIGGVHGTEDNTYSHICCKGISKNAILDYLQGEGLTDLNKLIYDGEEQIYDLVKGGAVFERNEVLTIYSRLSFQRCVKRLVP